MTIKVIQADRDAAANLYLDLEGLPYRPRDLAVAEDHRSGDLDQHPSIQAFARHRIESAAQARREAIKEAARACEDQMQVFLSPEYATGQPLSSFHERFACGQCAAAIRSLSPESKGD